ncbi:uncharacterized protein LOC112693741 [Sipha flava]|uniref:Uncharacterized protein LOC112693741 n=2 Tax=Sipha flava TaxID=143950 RepID=A0A8B8GQ33_9HEMI|nr:uncharacterized protein LOC112693741 [Sipha flava]XP_025424722.1 uncharacterized protein LOC112693741 [Sipha flava]
MGVKENVVTKIIKNELRNRKKQNKINDIITTKKVNTSQSIKCDDEYTLLLKQIVNERKIKKTKIEAKLKQKSTHTKNNEVKCNNFYPI